MRLQWAVLAGMSTTPTSFALRQGGDAKSDSRDRSRLIQKYQTEIRQGRLGTALETCERLVELGQSDGQTWYNLGYLRRCARQYRSALKAYAKALELGAAQPEQLHLNRAAILLDHLGQVDAAVEELQNAIAIAPEFLMAWLNLGQAYEDLGDKGKAIDAYRQALALDPICGKTVARLYGLGALSAGAINDVLTMVRPSSDDAAELHIALAHHYEREREYNCAFAEMVEANRIVRSLTPPAQIYDPQAAAVQAQRLATFVPPEMTAPSDFGSNLIFVIGMFRSGSTLAERILARHSRIRSLGESEAIPAIAAGFTNIPAEVTKLDETQQTRLANHYLDEAREKVGEYDMLADKRLDNFLHVPLIKTLFPGAKIVHTRRDACDTMLSIFGNLFGPGVTYANQLEDIADWQVHHDALIERWNVIWPGSIHSLDYEQLVTRPAETIPALLSSCGLDWDDNCLNPAGGAGVVQTLSSWQVRQSIHTRSVGRSRPFQKYIDGALRKR